MEGIFEISRSVFVIGFTVSSMMQQNIEAVARNCSVKKVFLIKKETLAHVFSCEIYENLRTGTKVKKFSKIWTVPQFNCAVFRHFISFVLTSAGYDAILETVIARAKSK